MLRTLTRLLYWSGLPWLFREVYARRKVTIVNYHNPKQEIFEKHARFYSQYYSFVNIDQVVHAIESGTTSSLPVKPLLITFDDGHIGNADLLDILQRYQIPAVIYAVAGVVNTLRHFWFDRLNHHGKAMRTLKNLADDERRLRLRRDYDHWDEKEYDRPVALSSQQLKDLISIGCTLGSHTLFHPLLDRCNPDIGFRECLASRELLESLIGKPVVHFALPNGNVNENVLEWVRKAGYRSCRTTRPGWPAHYSSPFLLPNFGIDDATDTYKVALQACGLWDVIKKTRYSQDFGTLLREYRDYIE